MRDPTLDQKAMSANQYALTMIHELATVGIAMSDDPGIQSTFDTIRNISLAVIYASLEED